MKLTAITGAVAVALLGAAGCGSSGGPAAYLGTSGTEVSFIQWQESSSGHLQGTIMEDRASGTAPGETV
jgi:hypothetical protein